MVFGLLFPHLQKWDNGVSWGLSSVKFVWFISHNNKQDTPKHWLILCVLVREGYGREISKFVVLLLFSPFMSLRLSCSSFIARWLFYDLYFCISATCIRLFCRLVWPIITKILLRFSYRCSGCAVELRTKITLPHRGGRNKSVPVCLFCFSVSWAHFE